MSKLRSLIEGIEAISPKLLVAQIMDEVYISIVSMLGCKKLVPTGGNNYRTISVLETFKEMNNHNRSN